VLGLVKRGRENSQNAISDDLKNFLSTPSVVASAFTLVEFVQSLPQHSSFISVQLPFYDQGAF
jgi:ABC-type phosphate transport system permease subunit